MATDLRPPTCVHERGTLGCYWGSSGGTLAINECGHMFGDAFNLLQLHLDSLGGCLDQVPPIDGQKDDPVIFFIETKELLHGLDVGGPLHEKDSVETEFSIAGEAEFSEELS